MLCSVTVLSRSRRAHQYERNFKRAEASSGRMADCGVFLCLADGRDVSVYEADVGHGLWHKGIAGSTGIDVVRHISCPCLSGAGICLADLPGRVSAGLQSFSEKENIRADCPAGYL